MQVTGVVLVVLVSGPRMELATCSLEHAMNILMHGEALNTHSASYCLVTMFVRWEK